jgi:hypothetical protein
LIRSFALVVIVAAIFTPSTIAGSVIQRPDPQTAASLLTGDGVAGAAVVLKKKADVQQAGEPASAPPPTSAPRRAPSTKPQPRHASEPAADKKTNKDGSFAFENVTVGTYNLTFDAPKVSPAAAGKVEYLVIVQEVEAGGVKRNITYDDSKAKTARIPITRINDGFDFTVGPTPPPPGTSVSKSNRKNNSAVTDSQKTIDLHGKIFLVEIGTTRKWVDAQAPR